MKVPPVLAACRCSQWSASLLQSRVSTVTRLRLNGRTARAAGPPLSRRPTAPGWVDPFPVIGAIEGFWGPGADDVWAWSDWIVCFTGTGEPGRSPSPSGGRPRHRLGGVPGGIWLSSNHVPELTQGCVVFAAHERTNVSRRTADGWRGLGGRENLPPEATKPDAGRLDAGELARLWSRYRGDRTVPEGVVMATATRVGGGPRLGGGREGPLDVALRRQRWASAMNPNLGTRAIGSRPRPTAGRWARTRFARTGRAGRWHATASRAATRFGAPRRRLVASGSVPLHWDGSRWSEVPLPMPAHLGPLWGSAANDIWAAPSYGGRGAAFHWDGGAWRQHDIPGLSVPRGRGLDAPLVIPERAGRRS